MTLQDAVKGRRSIRKYKRDAVPGACFRKFWRRRAGRHPGKYPAWEFYVLTGKPLAEFKKANRQK